MAVTPGGIVTPAATDDPDIPGDLATMAASIEAGLAWVTTGFTVTAGVWTLTTFRVRRVGSLCFLRVDVTKATSAITVAAGGGDIANSVLGVVPGLYVPAFSQGLQAGPIGRGAFGFIDSGGNVTLSAVAGDGTNIAVGDPIGLGGCYVLG